VLTSAACSHDSAAGVRRYSLTGVVSGGAATPPRTVVAHDAVDGLMPAMSMAFEIRGDSPPLRDGDRIAATLVVSANGSWLEEVKVTGRAPAAAAPVASSSRAMPGAVVPDLPLVDQNGRSITLRSVGGAARPVRVVTFIYTRCPLPDFCPLMVSHLETLRRRAIDAGVGDKLALLGVTLDPAFDTPPVLRAYGESMLKGSNRFDQWTLATGTAAQVEEVARFFGVGYRAGGGVITHTLTTAVIGHDGRIIRVFASNSWRPDDLFDVVRAAIERAAVQ